jgi:hypothetical protein
MSRALEAGVIDGGAASGWPLFVARAAGYDEVVTDHEESRGWPTQSRFPGDPGLPLLKVQD